MEGTYAVTIHGEKSGSVSLTRRGLFYEVICHCKATRDQMLNLMVKTKTTEENLGVLIPVLNGLELRKQIPIKRIGEGEPLFYLQVRQDKVNDFMPVNALHSFPWLHRLDECVFSIRNGEIGVEGPTKNNTKKVEI